MSNEPKPGLDAYKSLSLFIAATSLGLRWYAQRRPLAAEGAVSPASGPPGAWVEGQRAANRRALGLAGLGAIPPTTDDAKEALTLDVESLERMLSSGASHDVLREVADALRTRLRTVRAWDDGGWPWSSWDAHASLLERVNNAHRASIARNRPGVINPDLVLEDGSVVEDSVLAAAAEGFADSVQQDVSAAFDAASDFASESHGLLAWTWEHRKPLGLLGLLGALWALSRKRP